VTPETSRLFVGAGALTDYFDWLKKSKHGDILIYHEGDLQFDRFSPEGEDARSEAARTRGSLNAIANNVRADAKAGNIRLTQRRIGESKFEYRATRIRTEHITGKKNHARHSIPV
jgi:hypothetical protein